MVFGKIDYLNLLPFYVFLKKTLKTSSQRTALSMKKGTPASINVMFEKKRIDAAVISSIKSFKYRSTDMGIVAQNDVLSVLVIPGTYQKDEESNTSNALAQVLDIEGKIVIGDKALKECLKGTEAIDLAHEWKKRFDLPFVFARLCFHKDKKLYEKLSHDFLKKRVRIPHYLLKKRSQKTGIKMEEINHYLTKISYKISKKEELSLKKFYNECKKKRLLQ